MRPRSSPSRSTACAATSKACVESCPPDTPTTTRRASGGSAVSRRANEVAWIMNTSWQRRSRLDGSAGTNGCGSGRRRSVWYTVAGRVSSTSPNSIARNGGWACVRTLLPNDVWRMRSCTMAPRSTSTTTELPCRTKRSVSPIRMPRSATSPCPSHARSDVDSPNPAALYSCTARFRADEAHTSSCRYSHFATVMFDADRLPSTVAPASAARVLGGTGTHRSSQMSTCSMKPGRCRARSRTSVPNGTSCPSSRIVVARAASAGWNQRSS